MKKWIQDAYTKSPIQRIGEAIGGKMAGGFQKTIDQSALDFAKGAAKKFSTGNFTASQTGARQFAAERRARTANAMVMKDVGGETGDLENYSINQDPLQRKVGGDKSIAKKGGHWWWETQ
jgi:hypothetical protein